MRLQIRNMESTRCIALVKLELDKLGLRYRRVDLGEIVLKDKISNEKLRTIDNILKISGLEIIADKKLSLVEKIKTTVDELINLSDNDQHKPTTSDYISMKVNYDYAYLSNLFSSVVGITIEKYIITRKIERVKEMLVYEGLSLNEIAYRLQYSSVAHLSNQFKKVTGLTPSYFSKLRDIKHHKITDKSLDE